MRGARPEARGIDGNHENWARLDHLGRSPRWQDDDGDPSPVDVADHVTLLPRGHRWELGGRSFVALGGAPSVNRLRLTEDVDWWPSEVIQEGHVRATLAGGHAEVMLTHDSAGAAVLHRAGRGHRREQPPRLAGLDPRLRPRRVSSRLTRAVVGVAPLLLAHGHFHVAGEAVVRLPGAAHDTTVWSLAADQDTGNVRLLDLDTLTDASAGGSLILPSLW